MTLLSLLVSSTSGCFPNLRFASVCDLLPDEHSLLELSLPTTGDPLQPPNTIGSKATGVPHRPAPGYERGAMHGYMLRVSDRAAGEPRAVHMRAREFAICSGVHERTAPEARRADMRAPEVMRTLSVRPPARCVPRHVLCSRSCGSYMARQEHGESTDRACAVDAWKCTCMTTAGADGIAELLGDRADEAIVERIANIGATLDEVAESNRRRGLPDRFGDEQAPSSPRSPRSAQSSKSFPTTKICYRKRIRKKTSTTASQWSMMSKTLAEPLSISLYSTGGRYRTASRSSLAPPI
jgi:hypothetical protein